MPAVVASITRWYEPARAHTKRVGRQAREPIVGASMSSDSDVVDVVGVVDELVVVVGSVDRACAVVVVAAVVRGRRGRGRRRDREWCVDSGAGGRRWSLAPSVVVSGNVVVVE